MPFPLYYFRKKTRRENRSHHNSALGDWQKIKRPFPGKNDVFIQTVLTALIKIEIIIRASSPKRRKKENKSGHKLTFFETQQKKITTDT